MKKFVLPVLISVLIAGNTLFLTACNKNDSHVKLSCDENGEFTILIVSDPQCDTSMQWDEAKSELEILVQRAEPDLVLINGDMNSKNKISEDMWDKFISPLTKRNIYWATTNGNHDPFKYENYQMYKSYDKCLNSIVSTLDSNYEFDRPMNYVIPVYSNDGRKTVFAVYGMDTGNSNAGGYEGLTERQINWYEAQSDNLKRINGGEPVTSILCMHIPLPQTVDMYYSIEGGGTATEKVPGGLYDVYGTVNEPKDGMKNYVCENGTTVPKSRFAKTAPGNDRGMFDRILKQGDIKGVFFGHDHQTNFVGSYKGVILGFAGKLSTGCYSDKFCRGGRVVKFNQSNPEKFQVKT